MSHTSAKKEPTTNTEPAVAPLVKVEGLTVHFDAGRAVSEIMYSGILPSALEVVNQQTLIAINQNTDLNLPEVEAILVVETDGYTREETEFQLAKIIDIFNKNNASTVKKAESQEEAEALWQEHIRGDRWFITPFSKLGSLNLDFEPAEEVSNYCRELDIGEAEFRMRYEVGDIGWERQMFVSVPDRVMVKRIATDIYKYLKSGKSKHLSLLDIGDIETTIEHHIQYTWNRTSR